MTSLQLIYGNDQHNTVEALRDSDVQPDGIELIPVRYPSFYTILNAGGFDVADISFLRFLVAVSRGRKDWYALPVFPSRQFFHADILTNVNSGIRKPQDLKGKRFGIPEYDMSAGVWIRAVLQHDFGVAPHEYTWYLNCSEGTDRHGPLAMQLPKNITIHRLKSDQDLSTLLRNGELDATGGTGLITMLDRAGRVSIEGQPNIQRLFDSGEESGRFLQSRGYIPPNHVLVVKREIVEQHSWVAMSLFRAFERSKQAYNRVSDNVFLKVNYAQPEVWRAHRLGLSSPIQEQHALLERALAPCGVHANRSMMEHCAGFLFEQGLMDSRVEIEEYIPATLLDT